MHTPRLRSVTRHALVAFAAPLLLASPATFAAAPAAPPSQAPAASQKAGASKTAVTPEEHLAKAEEYKEKAAAYRNEAAIHHRMLEEYLGQAKTERSDQDPDRKKMRLHCEAYINQAEALATEAEKFADFHRVRAAGAQPAAGSAARQTQAAGTQKPETIKVAVTSTDHLALAEEYRKKAAGYRAEAALHKTMLESYKQALSGEERVSEDPYVTKMRLHCEAYIKPAEALAKEAEKFADYHRMSAAELKGK